VTDAELRDAAWSELTKTTITYTKWKNQGFTVGHWANAKTYLDQIGQTTPPPTGILYGEVEFEDGTIPFPWSPSQFFPTGTKPPTVIADPLGQRGKVLLLEADYTPQLPLDSSYPSSANQQTAISINPDHAHAGMDEHGNIVTSGMETWYSFWIMALAGNVWANGETNWCTEWHDTTGGAGPKSSGMFAFGGYPLTTAGTSAAKFMHRETVDSGGGVYVNRYFPGNYDDPNLAAPDAPAFTLGVWHRVVFRKIWAVDPAVGLVEWWVDGVKLASQHLQTQATNDYYSWAVYNYRVNVNGSSKIHYDGLKWGSTAAAVGFMPA
jgi:hypothetical protein